MLFKIGSFETINTQLFYRLCCRPSGLRYCLLLFFKEGGQRDCARWLARLACNIVSFSFEIMHTQLIYITVSVFANQDCDIYLCFFSRKGGSVTVRGGEACLPTLFHSKKSNTQLIFSLCCHLSGLGYFLLLFFQRNVVRLTFRRSGTVRLCELVRLACENWFIRIKITR